MKVKLKPREAYIVHAALAARVTVLTTMTKNGGKSGELAKQLKATKALFNRLFPASVIVKDD